MKRKQKTLEEKIITFLGKIFAMLLLSGTFAAMFAYGLLHATTLN